MSVWADIHKRSNGAAVREEDKMLLGLKAYSMVLVKEYDDLASEINKLDDELLRYHSPMGIEFITYYDKYCVYKAHETNDIDEIQNLNNTITFNIWTLKRKKEQKLQLLNQIKYEYEFKKARMEHEIEKAKKENKILNIWYGIRMSMLVLMCLSMIAVIIAHLVIGGNDISDVQRSVWSAIGCTFVVATLSTIIMTIVNVRFEDMQEHVDKYLK